MSLAFEIIRYMTMVFVTVQFYWKWVHAFCSPNNGKGPSRKFFLSDDDDYDDSYSRVPEDAVYVEEWVDDDGNKLCYVQYEGEEIVEHSNPFEKKARRPWLTIGDEDTDIELTQTFNRYLVPGNVIRLDLVQKLIHITENTRLMYIESGTLEVKKFPGDGILIEEDV
jgi:hypothetical protein